MNAKDLPALHNIILSHALCHVKRKAQHIVFNSHFIYYV